MVKIPRGGGPLFGKNSQIIPYFFLRAYLMSQFSCASLDKMWIIVSSYIAILPNGYFGETRPHCMCYLRLPRNESVASVCRSCPSHSLSGHSFSWISLFPESQNEHWSLHRKEVFIRKNGRQLDVFITVLSYPSLGYGPHMEYRQSRLHQVQYIHSSI